MTDMIQGYTFSLREFFSLLVLVHRSSLAKVSGSGASSKFQVPPIDSLALATSIYMASLLYLQSFQSWAETSPAMGVIIQLSILL